MNFTKPLTALFVAGTALSLIGCAEDVDSDDIRTSGMYAKIEAVAGGDGETTVRTELRVGGDNGTYVELEGEDMLTVTMGEDSKEPTHENSGNRHWYDADFNNDAGGTKINVAFTRGAMDDNAEKNDATLPEPFALSFPDDQPDEVSRDDDITVEWSNPVDGGTIYWQVEGDCIWNEDGNDSDDGSYTFDSGEIRVQDEGESCEIDITFERINNGDIDPAFEEGGKFEAIQRRKITITSTPGLDEFDDVGAGGAGGAGN